MSSKNVQHFWFEVEASTKNGLYFCRTYLVTELNHIVFDFGHLNTINNLNVQINVGKLLGVTEIIQNTPITVSRIL